MSIYIMSHIKRIIPAGSGLRSSEPCPPPQLGINGWEHPKGVSCLFEVRVALSHIYLDFRSRSGELTISMQAVRGRYC